MKTAIGMVRAAERDGLIKPDTILLESSSGNLGIALSVMSASRAIRFLCITDPRCNEVTIRQMRALGAEVIIVDETPNDGGYLAARLAYVRRLCASDSRYLWLNQYVNEANALAHYELTAPEIIARFPKLDVLFVGVGTGGTAMGCARRFREDRVRARTVAVDAVGSVTFGQPAAQRLIPGLGASVLPPLVQRDLFDDVVHVREIDTISVCRTLSRRGFLLGGSSGTVVSGALAWLERYDSRRRLQSVAILPDLGERYVETIYDDGWVAEHFGDDTAAMINLDLDQSAWCSLSDQG